MPPAPVPQPTSASEPMRSGARAWRKAMKRYVSGPRNTESGAIVGYAEWASRTGPTVEKRTLLSASLHLGENAIFAAPGLGGDFDTVVESSVVVWHVTVVTPIG